MTQEKASHYAGSRLQFKVKYNSTIHVSVYSYVHMVSIVQANV
jgi:hypothetical protein